MQPSIVILAAGLGSRYGGLKQLDAVGPADELILDYSVFDAIQAGFDRVVFVIRPDFHEAFQARVARHYTRAIKVEYAFQSLDALPAGFAVPTARAKPWGTGHALWCARGLLDGPFAVMNADDFYGREAFVRLAAHLRSGICGARPDWAMIGYRLARTLSEHGAVSRGICRVSPESILLDVTETTGICSDAVGVGRTYSGREIVSMNCWGLTPALFAPLGRMLEAFLSERSGDSTAEFYLPAAIATLVAAGASDVRVLPTRADWLGVTYREDKRHVSVAIKEMVAAGVYPEGLFAAQPDASTR
jgi:choline kinase